MVLVVVWVHAVLTHRALVLCVCASAAVVWFLTEQVCLSNRGGDTSSHYCKGAAYRLSKLNSLSPNGSNVFTAFYLLLCQYCSSAVLIVPSAYFFFFCYCSVLHSAPSNTNMTGELESRGDATSCCKVSAAHTHPERRQRLNVEVTVSLKAKLAQSLKTHSEEE